jgi:hypothetical protein
MEANLSEHGEWALLITQRSKVQLLSRYTLRDTLPTTTPTNPVTHPFDAKFFGRLVDYSATDCETLVVIDFIDHAIMLKRHSREDRCLRCSVTAVSGRQWRSTDFQLLVMRPLRRAVPL